MNEEQETAYKKKQTNLDDIIKSKFGIFYFFQDEIQKANEYVYNADFLTVNFPSWNVDLGIVKFNTPEINFTKIRDIYEPYRTTIRNSLFFIFVGLAIVYVVKYILNYGVTGSDVNKVMSGGGKSDN